MRGPGRRARKELQWLGQHDEVNMMKQGAMPEDTNQGGKPVLGVGVLLVEVGVRCERGHVCLCL